MTVADQAAAAGLHRVGARPPLLRYLVETWDRRDFIVTLARSRQRAANEANRLGMLWMGLRPLINAGIYSLIFGGLLGVRHPGWPASYYVAFIVIGIFFFEFFSSCMIQGAKSITNGRSLVQSLSFPRITLPLASVAEQFLVFLASSSVLFVILLITGNWPRWEWLLFPPLVALFTIFNTAVALIFARFTTVIVDVQQFLPYVSRILFYTSGVIWQLSWLQERLPAWLNAIFQFHPLVQALEIARGVLLKGYTYPLHYWAAFAAWAIGLLVIAVWLFWSAEETYGRVN